MNNWNGEVLLRPESLVVAAGRPVAEPDSPLNTGIALSSTFRHGEHPTGYLRQRGSDGIGSFEEAIGALDGGHAVAFASGMAAVAAVLDTLPAGAKLLLPEGCYGGVSEIASQAAAAGRLVLQRVQLTDTAAVIAALDDADLLWIESPSNPLLEVADVPALVAAARAAGVRSCVDATFCTPLALLPLALGADLVVHSATKYLAGHTDVLMGVVVAADVDGHAAVLARRSLTGALPGALEAFLALRGLRTLAVRLERATANAADLARRLVDHSAITRVRYPGLPDDPYHQLAASFQTGFGAMVSFEIHGSGADAEAVCERVRLIAHATSLGGVESLIERRARYSMDAGQGVPGNLLRLSVGIEHVEDIWADLDQALTSR